jgi:hypothetical protein
MSLVAAGLMLGQITSAHAATSTTFAQFQDGTPGSFLTNSFSGGAWTGATLGTTGPTPYPILFTFQPSSLLGYIPYTPAGVPLEGENISAILTYTATTQPNIGGGLNNGFAAATATDLVQPWASVTINVTATGAMSGLGTLLSMTATAASPTIAAGNLDGTPGGTSAALKGSDVGSTSVVTFMSPYIDFTGATTNNYGLSYSGVSPSYTASGPMFGQWITNFNAETTGTFAAAWVAPPTTPEPSAVSLLVGMGATGSLLLRRRRK